MLIWIKQESACRRLNTVTSPVDLITGAEAKLAGGWSGIAIIFFVDRKIKRDGLMRKLAL